jgi:hypothetical protein
MVTKRRGGEALGARGLERRIDKEEIVMMTWRSLLVVDREREENVRWWR